jgi:hypothetical protein
MSRAPLRVAALVAVIACGSLWVQSAASSAGASSPPIKNLTWLAAGDSYASGQGLPHPAGACASGTGQDGSGSAWAITAAGILTGKDGVRLANGSPDLVACTGAISDQFFNADGSANEPQWTPAMGPYDLVTFSFGGDDIQFKSTITQCTLTGGFCAPANTERNKITELGSTGDYVLGIHEPGFPAFLNHVANAAVVPGGNVVVMGYPDIFENPSKWGGSRNNCSGFLPFIVNRLRGWGGDLNATIGEAVVRANAEPASERNGVHFTFINPTNGGGVVSPSNSYLFEPSTGLHHELCSRGYQTWMNGFSLPKSHSYHPNQDGETAMGQLAAQVIAKLHWPSAPWDTPPVSVPASLSSLIPWGKSGVSAPWTGCNLYLPTVAGVALDGTPTYYTETAGGYSPQTGAAVQAGAAGVFYEIGFNNAIAEVVFPANTTPPWAPDPTLPARITSYVDGSEVQSFGGDSDIDLITIPGQACSYEVLTDSAYPPSLSTYNALVNSLRPIKGRQWRSG